MHPHNKHERRLIGMKKGYRRAKGMQEGWDWLRLDRKKWIHKNSRRLQDTTTLCGCAMCRNPRRVLDARTAQEMKDAEYVASELETYDEIRNVA